MPDSGLKRITGIADNNVVQVDGSPSADQVAVWTANGVEGDANLTFSGLDLALGANIGLTFGTGEKIEGDSTNLTITSGNDIALAAAADVNIPVNVGLRFGDGGENIETDNTNLTITSGGELLLTPTSDVVIPVNIGLHFGDGAEKIESDNTDLTINSGGKIKLSASGDIECNTHKITGVVDPTADQEAATKKYVDDTVQGSYLSVATIENPAASDAFIMFFTFDAITVSEIEACRSGGTSYSFNIWHDPTSATALAGGPNKVLDAAEVITADEGFTDAVMDDYTIPADSYVVLYITAVDGAVTQAHISMEYTKD